MKFLQGLSGYMVNRWKTGNVMFYYTSPFILLLSLLWPSLSMAAAPVETGTFNNYAIYGYDPVAYFTEGKAVKGDKNINYEWRGAQWHFANTEHKTLFANAPEMYAPQYGGYCAYAMSDGRLVGIDEDAFTIYQGKLYLNYSESVMQEWRTDIASYIRQADALYPTKVTLASPR
jgi:YHS domain-containing protein